MKIHCSCICKRSGKDINEKVIKGLCPKRITPDVTAYSRIQVWPSGKHLTMRLYVKSVAASTTWQQRKESNFKVEWEGGQFSGYLNNPGVQNYELFLIILQNNNNTWLILFLNPAVTESNLREFPKRYDDDFDEPRRNKIIVVRQRFRNLFWLEGKEVHWRHDLEQNIYPTTPTQSISI